jgi:hypothetical protein
LTAAVNWARELSGGAGKVVAVVLLWSPVVLTADCADWPCGWRGEGRRLTVDWLSCWLYFNVFQNSSFVKYINCLIDQFALTSG